MTYEPKKIDKKHDLHKYANTVIAVVALTTSYFTYQNGKNLIKTNIRPSLIFTLENKKTWKLENYGVGPAINIVVCHQNHNSSNCNDAKRIDVLSVKQSTKLNWIKTNRGSDLDKIIAQYEDVNGNKYESIVDEGKTTMNAGDITPTWKPGSVRHSRADSK